MKTSLYQRLALALLLLFIAVGGVFYWWSQNLERVARNEAEQRLHIALAEHLANDNPLLKQGVYDYEALSNLFHTLMILGPSFEFYFVDPKGKILTYSAKPGEVKREKIDLLPVLALINQQQALPIYGDDPRSTNGKKIFSVSGVYNDGNLQGYLYVILGSQIYDSIFSRVQSNQLLSQSMAVVAGLVVFFFAVLLGLLRFLTMPLKALNKDIQAFKQAKFEKSKVNLRHWPAAKNNELHELGQTFNSMAEQINYLLAQLQNNDTQRRELLAHLSHDLRTPLASLQGYLETIQLKGDELEADKRQSFVDVAYKNANQLKRLVDQIFELAHLEGGQVTVSMETFPLGELLYDIGAKFAIKFQQAQLDFVVEPQHAEINVYADIGKLERVLSNLIENAIRHTKAGGKITLKVNELEGQKISVAVIDNGSGIAEKELPYIFDARYRASNAVDDKKQHGGLGLAISQKLMGLMHADISVESKLGVGTQFNVKLNRVEMAV